jgi:hypothetical protein
MILIILFGMVGKQKEVTVSQRFLAHDENGSKSDNKGGRGEAKEENGKRGKKSVFDLFVESLLGLVSMQCLSCTRSSKKASTLCEGIAGKTGHRRKCRGGRPIKAPKDSDGLALDLM